MPKDVLEECRVIKSFMSAIGWTYHHGGPFPHSPTLVFKRDGQTLKINVQKEGK